MALQLSTATVEDLPAIVRAEFNAFHPHDTLHRIVYPSPQPVPEQIIQRTVERQAKTMEDPHVTWLKITDTNTKEIIAAARWVIYPSNPAQSSSSAPSRWPASYSNPHWILPEETGLNVGAGVDDPEYVHWIMEEWFTRRRAQMEGPLVLLDLCLCDPKHHRRGAGKMLVNWGVQKADELKLTAFVEASFTGERLYQSCGFVTSEDVCLDGGKVKEAWKEYGTVEYKFMIREKRL